MLLATSNFLVPNFTLVFELVAFVIVLGVLGTKVLPVLNQRLTERQEQIRGELEAADKAKVDAEEADVERRKELEEARRHAREIITQANATSDQVTAGAQARAQSEYERIVQAADVEIAAARQAAVQEVTARVAEIVLAAAERVIGREIRAADHQDLIDEAIAAIAAEADSGTTAGASGAAR
ncbi:MAG: F0F1 ATP synthase subunit B [Acidimicrobiales bacterium]